jgi:hypothetical protein
MTDIPQQNEIYTLLTRPDVASHINAIKDGVAATGADLKSFASILQHIEAINSSRETLRTTPDTALLEELRILSKADDFFKIALSLYPEMAEHSKAECYIQAALDVQKSLQNKAVFPKNMSDTSSSTTVEHIFNTPSEWFSYEIQVCEKIFGDIATSIDQDIASYVAEQTKVIGESDFVTHHSEL